MFHSRKQSYKLHQTLPVHDKCDYIWNDMTKNNHWIHIGGRGNRVQQYCYGFGGYVIEKMKLNQ